MWGIPLFPSPSTVRFSILCTICPNLRIFFQVLLYHGTVPDGWYKQLCLLPCKTSPLASQLCLFWKIFWRFRSFLEGPLIAQCLQCFWRGSQSFWCFYNCSWTRRLVCPVWFPWDLYSFFQVADIPTARLAAFLGYVARPLVTGFIQRSPKLLEGLLQYCKQCPKKSSTLLLFMLYFDKTGFNMLLPFSPTVFFVYPSFLMLFE